jgi:hypothetical protein
MKITYKCPHCGWTFPAAKTLNGLTPIHNFGDDERATSVTVGICPGAGKRPRGVNDARPLGKDEITERPRAS